jgi:tol-pal system protein YbgF
MKGLSILFGAGLCLVTAISFAGDVPVVDATPMALDGGPANMEPSLQNTVDNTTSIQQGSPNNNPVPQDASSNTPRMLSSQDINNSDNSTYSVASKVQQMQQTIDDLRGIVEMQGHQIKNLETSQRTMYADLDKRVATLEGIKASSLPAASANDTSINKPKSVTPDEKQVYQDAFQLISNKKYSDAIEAFKNYLQKYPTGIYVPNAHYWLGELYAISGDNRSSLSEFSAVVSDYASSNKAPDALLKLGSMAFNQGNFDQAEKYWSQLTSNYPNSAAARIAGKQLRQLKK